MNRTEPIQRRENLTHRLLKWPLVCGLLAVVLARPAPAADALYQNDAIVNYPLTVANPPVIDATNFVNNGTFVMNFTAVSLTLVQPFYETFDTLNYTNGDNGLMLANTGFQFDNQTAGTGARTMSASFYNSGTISCGSATNTGDVFLGLLGLFGYSQCLVSATNIVNPGAVDVGVDGIIKFGGQNVDLSYSTLNIEGAGASFFGSGVFGLNTNFWDPSQSFGIIQNTGLLGAESAIIPVGQQLFFDNSFDILFLTNCASYIDIAAVDASNNIIRAVFIEDESPTNVSYNVYFDSAGLGFGGGNVTIEWVGSYLDAASGNAFNNYLYLNDNYVRGASTNVLLNANGYPDNFTFTESSTPQATGVNPAPAGFQNIFPAGAITNLYSFANVQLATTTVSTNSVVNGSVTNLPGRIQINATNQLTLVSAQITGPNYLSVQSPHQYNGSGGALIQSPYSDLNLGVTNGFLTVSNLLSPLVPNWNGNVQAWNTRFLAVDANGVTNDFRVLIVGSVLNSATLAQVQDLFLHGTNSIVISDTMNVMRTLTADAQNLTLTTNGPGNGANSVDGELNVISPNIFFASSFPNLRNLTNNGAIRFQNLVQFSGLSNNITAVPGISAVAATGRLTEATGRTNVLAGNQLLIGTNLYTFVKKATNSVPNQVVISAKFDGTMSNLIAAINRTAGAGTNYSTNTAANPLVIAGSLTNSSGLLTNHSFVVTARTAGSAGNSIATAASVVTTNLTWSGHTTLAGGADAVAGSTNTASGGSVPYRNFINTGMVSDQGSTIWATNFVSSGTISNGLGSFLLQSLTTTLTNGSVVAAGDISITASSLVTSNLNLQAGKSLVLTATNLLTDTGVTNGSVWSIQNTNSTGGNGLIMPIKPLAGDLLGTTIYNYSAGPNKQVLNVWAGQDRGANTGGYTNNEAVGRLILDAAGAVSTFKFSGAGTSNALYVDYLELREGATNRDLAGNLTALQFNTNLVIYYAQAVANGISYARLLNHKNSDHLRWVPTYAGYYSSTNLVYPPGVTNVVNAALAADQTIDSDGDGTPNGSDPTPFFVPAQLNFTSSLTNVPPLKVRIQWQSVPAATNYLFYTTNLLSGNWLVFTNFISPTNVPPVAGWPLMNSVYDTVRPAQQKYFKVRVDQNTTILYGP
jgi:hypothetical protein